jgi:hypothetical protein
VRNTTRFRVVLLILALATAGCDRSEPPPSVVGPSPTARLVPIPTPQPTPTPLVLRGYVQDTAYRPLSGARVEVLDGPQTGTSTTTGVDGQFSLTGEFDSTTRFSASLDGYIGATGTIGQCPPCPRDWLSFVLAVPARPASVAGDYTVTFMADRSCQGIPAELQTRSYAATMAPSFPDRLVDTSFTLTLNEGTFLAGHDRSSLHNSIVVGVAGNVIRMSFGSYGPGVVEQVARDTYLGFDGAVETVAVGSLQTITTSFQGWVNYCALNAPMGEYYNCPLGQAVARSECESANHQFILTRR